MLWVKFLTCRERPAGACSRELDATGASAYNARRRPGRPVRADPLQEPECEGILIHMARLRGNVKWFDPEKGWGFIRLEDGDEVFVHHSDIQGSGFRSLKDGAEVELEVERADRGPRARNVVAVGGGSPEAESSNRETGAAGDTGGRRRNSGRSRSRSADRTQRERTADRQEQPSAGALPERRTLDEQIRRRLSDRFTFPS